MKLFLFAVLMSVALLVSSQQVPTKSVNWSIGSNSPGGVAAVTNIQVPNFLAAGVQIAQQVPYIELLKLIEAFLTLKGEVAGRAWALLNDNAQLIAALRDTLISKLGTIHSLTLNTLIILRKVLEFAATLFGNVNVSFGATGPLVDKTFSFGR